MIGVVVEWMYGDDVLCFGCIGVGEDDCGYGCYVGGEGDSGLCVF